MSGTQVSGGVWGTVTSNLLTWLAAHQPTDAGSTSDHPHSFTVSLTQHRRDTKDDAALGQPTDQGT